MGKSKFNENMKKKIEEEDQNILARSVPVNVKKKKKSKNVAKKKAQKNRDTNIFPPYCTPEMIEKGLGEKIFIEGTIRINPKNYEDAFVANNTSKQPDIYISGMTNRNRALNGDEVVVDLLPESEWWVDAKLVEEYLASKDLEDLPVNTHKVESQNHSDMVIKFKHLGVRFDANEISKDKSIIENQSPNHVQPNVSLDLIDRLDSDFNCIDGLLVDNLNGVENDLSSASFDSKEAGATIEESVDNSSLENCTLTTNDILSDSVSVDCTEEVDFVIDEVVEVNHSRLLQKHFVNIEEGSKILEKKTCSQTINQNEENEKHNSKEASKSKKIKTPNGKSELHSKEEIIQFLKQNDNVVLLRGIPYKSTEQDIVNFFGESFSFVEKGILIPRTADGQSTGQAYVQFNNSEDVARALRKNKECIDSRYVEVFEGKSILRKLNPRTPKKPSNEKSKGRVFTIAQIQEGFPNTWKNYVTKTGRVVAIREMKHSRSAVGHLVDRPGDERFALFKPTDYRVPRMLIAKASCPPGFWKRQQDFENVLFVAKIIKWEKVKFAIGDLTHALGDDSSVKNCTTGILIENEVKTDEFTQDVLGSLPSLPFSIPEEEILSRKDLRQECIFTIDPLTARDLDDAVSIEKTNDGNYRVGVHIADVSYFVKEHTELDKEAQERATSVYLVQQVVPMLPRQLCENLCSLNPNEDRLTFSVEWKMTEDGDILEEWFGRSVINSGVKLAYEHAQDMLDHPNKKWCDDELPPIRHPWNTSIISEKVNMLQSIAVQLRQKREESGALRLDQPKLCFTLDSQTGLPQGFKMYTHRHSNRLIEEFMLLANTSVAKKLYKCFPKLAVLRNHFPPKDNMMAQLVKDLEKYKIYLDTSSSKTLQDSLNKYKPRPIKNGQQDDFQNRFRYQVLMNLLSKPMQRAKYFCSGYYLQLAENDREDDEVFDYHHHYALNVPLYTHFTSPIRRYPDILVHRLLDIAIKESTLDWEESVIQRLANHCNDKKHAAKLVSQASDEMFLASFIKECGPYVVEGMVIKVFDKAFDCLLFDMATVKRVYLENLVSDGKLQGFELVKRRQQLPELKLTWKDATDGDNQYLVTTIDVFSTVSVTLVPDKDKPLCFKADLNRS